MGAWEDTHNEGVDLLVALELAAAERRITELDDQLHDTTVERNVLERVLTNAAAEAFKDGAQPQRRLRAV
jgi:hypothetical protein